VKNFVCVKKRVRGWSPGTPPPNTLKKDEKSIRVLQNSNPQKTRKSLDFKGNSFREVETLGSPPL